MNQPNHNQASRAPKTTNSLVKSRISVYLDYRWCSCCLWLAVGLVFGPVITNRS